MSIIVWNRPVPDTNPNYWFAHDDDKNVSTFVECDCTDVTHDEHDACVYHVAVYRSNSPGDVTMTLNAATLGESKSIALSTLSVIAR